jgi:hypothetical protein
VNGLRHKRHDEIKPVGTSQIAVDRKDYVFTGTVFNVINKKVSYFYAHKVHLFDF